MYSLDTVDDRLKLLNSIADILAAHDNSIERELYTKNYAEQYGISLESLNSEVQKRRNRKQSGNRTYSLNKNTTQTRGLPEFLSVDSRYGELEYMLLVMLCNDNRLFSKVSKEYNTGAYMDEGARKIAEKLYNRLEQNKNCVLAELLNVLDPKEASYMVRITEINSGLEDTDKAVQQILNKLEILKLEDLQKQTIERIKNEEDGIKRQELGLEFSKRAERIAELKRLT